MVAQELLKQDHETCRACCKDILENVPTIAVLITRDEAKLYLSCFVNKQNFCCWSENNLKELRERIEGRL